RRSLALLLLLTPAVLLSQTDLTLTTTLPGPVGAFSELVVTGGNPVLLARDFGSVGIGSQFPAGLDPKAPLTVAGQASLGDNQAPPGNDALTLFGGPGGVESGLSMQDRSLADARWTIYPDTTRGTEMFWFDNSK